MLGDKDQVTGECGSEMVAVAPTEHPVELLLAKNCEAGSDDHGDQGVQNRMRLLRQRKAIHCIAQLLTQVVGNRFATVDREALDVNDFLISRRVIHQREKVGAGGHRVMVCDLLDEQGGIGNVPPVEVRMFASVVMVGIARASCASRR